MARQAAKHRRAGGWERQHLTRPASLSSEEPQVLRQGLDVALVGRDNQERSVDQKQRQQHLRRAGEPREGEVALGRQTRTRFRDKRLPEQGSEPGRGHERRILSTIDVVERPGQSGARKTLPPARRTTSAPTILSSAQSAPFTRISGTRAEMTWSGVGPS